MTAAHLADVTVPIHPASTLTPVPLVPVLQDSPASELTGVVGVSILTETSSRHLGPQLQA